MSGVHKDESRNIGRIALFVPPNQNTSEGSAYQDVRSLQLSRVEKIIHVLDYFTHRVRSLDVVTLTEAKRIVAAYVRKALDPRPHLRPFLVGTNAATRSQDHRWPLMRISGAFKEHLVAARNREQLP